MNFPRYVVFGEALTDMLRQDDGSWTAHPGGSCWNVARVGARLGMPTGFAGAVSRDLFGTELQEASAAAGLDARFLQSVDKPPFLAMVTSRHPPQYFFVGADSADLHFDPSRLPAGWREAVEVVHFGSISLVREPLAGRLVEEARAAHAAGKRVAFDPNFRATMKAPAYAATLAEMLGLADYVKVSDEDLLGLFPSLDADAALAHLRNAAPAADILYTRGADGMSLLSGGKVYEQPAFRVEVADTVGCGDASMAGWIVGLIERAGAPAALQLRWSAACAALAATRHGPYAPTHAEVEQLLAHQALLSA